MMSTAAAKSFNTARKPEDLTARDILDIPPDRPDLLFGTEDKTEIKHIFHALARKWHPDRNPGRDVSEVFARVANLNKAAEEGVKGERPGVLHFTTDEGHDVNIKYLKKREFELGDMYISDNLVTYMVKKEFSDLFENGVKAIRGLKYADDGMREKTSRYLPEIHKVMHTATHDVLTLRKTPDQVLAEDLRVHAGGKIEPRHVAWMTSRLHNIGCYLQWAGTVHNAISAETCFISPEHHSVALLGGWWYAAKEGQNIPGLPGGSVPYAPRAVLEQGRADRRTDAALIRATSRHLLGDITGVALPRDPDIPRPMADWVCLPGCGDAIKDFRTWTDQVLLDSYGERKFLRYPVAPHDIYPTPIKGA
jgi:hypothetical protein